MEASYPLNDNELCHHILKKLKEKANHLGLSRDNSLRPETNSAITIPQEISTGIVDFFDNNVSSFMGMLEEYSNQLKTTLNFDLHNIFVTTLSRSEELSCIGDEITRKTAKSTTKLVKELFRYAIWPWIKESYFVNRGLLKPCGYPGDYIIVEEMYNGNPKTLGLGYIYDTMFLGTQLCQGLRNRKDQMKQILSNYFKLKNKGDVTILNVGCGGARELREISLPEKGLNLYLMDFDQEALGFAVANLNVTPTKNKIMPLCMDVLDLVGKENKNNIDIKPCDLIYSIGLFDYLPNIVLTRILIRLLSLLKKDGVLIFAHKDVSFYNPRIADWFCDWKYYSRTQDDFEQILKSLNIIPESISFSREKDGYIFFVEIGKV